MKAPSILQVALTGPDTGGFLHALAVDVNGALWSGKKLYSWEWERIEVATVESP